MIRAVVIVLLFCSVGVAFGQFERLSPAVNDPNASEVLPVISPDGSRLYFGRGRPALNGSTIVDIWYSDHDNRTDTFSNAKILGGRLGSRFGIAVTSVAPDNNTLYIIGKLRADTPPEDRVMVTHRIATGWSIPQPVRISNFKPESIVIDYAFGPDERTLILSMKSDSSIGGRDLYVCFLDDSTNGWTAPTWLGRDINSSSDEVTPFLSPDGRTLYFSSNRPGCIGDLDVWRSERLDDSWKHWSKPERLNNTINRPGRTTYYTEDAAGKYAYFVWRRSESEQTDIFRSPAPPRLTPVTLIRGRVVDDQGKPVEATIRYERLADGKVLGQAQSEPDSGRFQITLPAGNAYGLYVKKNGYLPASQTFDASDVKAFSTVEKDLILVKIKDNASIRLNNIFFETDKATLLPESYPELKRLADMMLGDRSLYVSIDGYTDSTGSQDHNQKLSLARAESVTKYLEQLAVEPSRLEFHGFGADKPIGSNATEEGRAENRRVEFRILKH